MVLQMQTFIYNLTRITQKVKDLYTEWREVLVSHHSDGPEFVASGIQTDPGKVGVQC